MLVSIKNLSVLFAFIAILSSIYYFRITNGELFIILASDFIIAAILNCLLLGYFCKFIKCIGQKQKLPPVTLDIIPYVLKSKLLLAIYLLTMMPFVIVDDIIKNQTYMNILYGINLFTFIPMSIILIGYCLKNNVFYYFKFFKLFDYIQSFIRLSSCFLPILILTYWILTLNINLILKSTILCFNVYIIHILAFVWFKYITGILLKYESENI